MISTTTIPGFMTVYVAMIAMVWKFGRRGAMSMLCPVFCSHLLQYSRLAF
jgi:hypothetical protein